MTHSPNDPMPPVPGSPASDLDDVIRRAAAASRDLIGSRTLEEIAGVLGRHLLVADGQFVALNVLLYDDAGRFAGLRTLASANRRQTFSGELTLDLTWDEIGADVRAAIETGTPMLVRDLQGDPDIHPRLKSWTATRAIRSTCLLPVRAGGATFGFMTVNSVTEPLDWPPAQIDLHQALANQVGGLISLYRLTDMAETNHAVIDNLVRANRLIALAQTPAEMAQAVTTTLGHSLAGAGIVLFDRLLTPGEYPAAESLVAAAIGERSLGIEPPGIPMHALHRSDLDRLRQGEPLTLTGPELERVVPDDLRAAWGDSPMIWSSSFPLRVGLDLLGTLVLVDTRQVELLPSQVEAFSAVAEQIGSTLRSHQLLDEAEEARNLAARLVQTNRAISSAESAGEIAAIITDAVPDEFHMAALIEFDQPATPPDAPEEGMLEAVATRGDVDLSRIVDRIDPFSPYLAPWLDRLANGQPIFAPNLTQVGNPLLPVITGHLMTFGADNLVIFGLRSGSRLLGLLVLGAREMPRLGEYPINNLLALADQVAVTLENRRLLNQTAEALGFVQTQYETSSALYRAETALDLLAGLHSFVGEAYDYAHLAVLEDADSGLMRVMAEIDYGMRTEGGQMLPLAEYPGLSAAGVDLKDSDTEPTLTDPQRATFQARRDGSLVILPLVGTDRRLLGAVKFTAQGPVEMPFNRSRALRSMADQLAIVLQNRQLLATAEGSLQETRALYEVNSTLLSAPDAGAVLRTLNDRLIPDASVLTLLQIRTNDAGDAIEEFSVLISLIAGEIYEMGLNLLAEMPLAEQRRFLEEWQQQGREVDFIEDVPGLIAARPALATTAASGIKSTIVIPIYENNRLIQQINIGFMEAREFDARTRRLFRAVSEQVTVVLQNLRLTEQRAISLEETSTLYEINRQLLNAGEPLEVLRILRHFLASDAQSLGLAQVDWDGSEIASFRLEALINAEGEQSPRQELLAIIPPEHRPLFLQEWELQGREIDFIEDLVSLVDQRPALQYAAGMGIRANIVIPIYTENKLTQQINITYPVMRTFDARTRRLYAAVRDQITIILENQRLLREAQNAAERLGLQARQFQAIAAFGQAVQSTLDVEVLLESILRETPNILEADHLSVLMIDRKRGSLAAVAVFEGEVYRISVDDPLPIEMAGTVIEQAWMTRAQVQIDDLAAEDGLRHGLRDDLRTVLIVPLISRGAVLGLIGIGAKAPNAYTETDVAIFQQIVSQVSVAMENADAYSQSQRLAQTKAAANEISSRLQQQVDLDRLLDLTMNELGRALGARRARLRLGTPASIPPTPPTPTHSGPSFPDVNGGRPDDADNGRDS
jgi:GAF domain-containing protein